MSEPRVANRYTFQGEGAEVSLTTGLSGEPVATLRIGERDASGVEVTQHASHWTIAGETERVHDLRVSHATVRIPIVHLSSSEPEPVTALLTIVTFHTNLAGPAGVTGPLESYQARLLDGEASEVQTLGDPGDEPADPVLGVHEFEQIQAICDHMPGSYPTPRLKVSGVIVFRTTGWQVAVRPASGNTGPIAEHLTLELVLTAPDGPSGDALTPVPFEYATDPEGIEYQQVSFRVVGTDDPPPPGVDVQHPQ